MSSENLGDELTNNDAKSFGSALVKRAPPGKFSSTALMASL